MIPSKQSKSIAYVKIQEFTLLFGYSLDRVKHINFSTKPFHKGFFIYSSKLVLYKSFTCFLLFILNLYHIKHLTYCFI